MMIGLVTEEGEEEGGGKSHCKVGTRWVRQTLPEAQRTQKYNG